MQKPLVICQGKGERRGEKRVRSKSAFVEIEEGGRRGERRSRSHNGFGQVDILEVEETEMPAELSDDCEDISVINVERSSSLVLSHTRSLSTVRKLGDVEMREISRKKKRNQNRAKAIVTSGALTFIVLAATIVTASFLMSPVIEQIFGQ